jgi:hypothetical protein
MSTTIVPPTNPEAQAKADALRKRLQGIGQYFVIDMTAESADHLEDLRAELAEIIPALHPNDTAALWLLARQFQGTTPATALWRDLGRPVG